MTKTWGKTKDARIKKRSDVYWARFMLRGQQVQKSLETKSFETAKRLVENMEKDILLGLNWRKDREFFDTAWPDFLEAKAKGIKTKKSRPKTLQGYIWFGEAFYLPNFKDKRLSEIDEKAWEELVEQIKTEKPGMHFDNVRKYLSGFLSWAYRTGKIRVKPELYDPDIERKEKRQADGPGLAYSKEQLKVMRSISAVQSPRFHLFMLMAQYMGMRPGEITQLAKDRIDLKENVIRLRKADTKTKTARDIPIHAKVLPALLFQLQYYPASPYLFPNMRNRTSPMDPTGFKKYWAEILSLPEISGRVYDFRHTFITHAIQDGLNPGLVAKITGTSWKMIETRYLHLTPKDLNKEIEKFQL